MEDEAKTDALNKAISRIRFDEGLHTEAEVITPLATWRGSQLKKVATKQWRLEIVADVQGTLPLEGKTRYLTEVEIAATSRGMNSPSNPTPPPTRRAVPRSHRRR